MFHTNQIIQNSRLLATATYTRASLYLDERTTNQYRVMYW